MTVFVGLTRSSSSFVEMSVWGSLHPHNPAHGGPVLLTDRIITVGEAASCTWTCPPEAPGPRFFAQLHFELTRGPDGAVTIVSHSSPNTT